MLASAGAASGTKSAWPSVRHCTTSRQCMTFRLVAHVPRGCSRGLERGGCCARNSGVCAFGRGGPAESALRLASGVSRPRPLPRPWRRTDIPISTVSSSTTDFGAAPAQFDLYKGLSPAACACVNFLRSCRIFGVFSSVGSQFCFRAPAVNFKGGHAIHKRLASSGWKFYPLEPVL